MKIGLGTVQFGVPYGIANRDGLVAPDEVAAILACARAGGIDTLDTAIGYGESERVLGEAGIACFKVVTKLPALPADVGSVDAWVQGEVEASLDRLGVNRVYGVLLHRANQLLDPHGSALGAALRGLKRAGLTEKVGVSVYSPDVLSALLTVAPIDLVQAPFNLVDRRLATSGMLAQLKELGVEIHVRSAFLQGLLLMAPDERPARFDRWSHIWSVWDAWRACHPGIDGTAACLSFLRQFPEIDRVIVGVDRAAQLSMLLAATEQSVSSLPDLTCDDPALIDPSQWSVA